MCCILFDIIKAAVMELALAAWTKSTLPPKAAVAIDGKTVEARRDLAGGRMQSVASHNAQALVGLRNALVRLLCSTGKNPLIAATDCLAEYQDEAIKKVFIRIK